MGPSHFAGGLARGSFSLFRSTVFALSDSSKSIMESVATGMAFATFDRQFAADRQYRSRDRPANIVAGVLHGVRELGGGVLGGLAGVVSKPVQGARYEGVGGLVKVLERA